MITVTISINGQPILCRSARNTGEQDSQGRTLYHCDNGQILHHHPGDGAVVLAKMMLDTVEDP